MKRARQKVNAAVRLHSSGSKCPAIVEPFREHLINLFGLKQTPNVHRLRSALFLIPDGPWLVKWMDLRGGAGQFHACLPSATLLTVSRLYSGNSLKCKNWSSTLYPQTYWQAMIFTDSHFPWPDFLPSMHPHLIKLCFKFYWNWYLFALTKRSCLKMYFCLKRFA